MTDLTTDDDGLMKVDALGRVQTPPERREALLDKFEGSGMSAKAFAEHYGIKYPTFNSWKTQRRKRGEKGRENGGSESFTLALAEVSKAEQPGPPGPLSIDLRGGHRLVIEDRSGVALAAALIRELAAS